MTVRRLHKFTASLLAGLFMLAFCFVAAPAVSASEGTDVGFVMSAILPENQHTNSTYFDLRMQPGQTQDLQVRVVNTGVKDIIVQVDAITASTAESGFIDYKTKGVQDETLKTPFSSIATPKQPELTVPAGESVVTEITVKMPEEEFDGIILGGISVTMDPSKQGDAQEEGEGIQIVNAYSYVTGVVLSETDTEVKPDFEGVSAYADMLHSRPAIFSEIRNSQAAIAKDVQMDIKVFRDGESTPKWEESKLVEFAPNSLLRYGVMITDGELEPGSYVSKVTLEKDGETWAFDLPFEVASNEANEINDNSFSPSPTAQGAQQMIPTWALIIIIALALILILLLVLLLVMVLRRNRK